MYCMECKQLWHDGDCVPVTKEIEEQEKVWAGADLLCVDYILLLLLSFLQVFAIDPAIAKDSCWPRD